MANRSNMLIGVLAGGFILAVLALVVVLVTLLGRPAQAQVAPSGTPRQVTVVGSGEVRGRPDTATVQIGVESNAATTQAALDQNNTQVQAVIDSIKALGVAEEDIQTRNFNIYPRYDSDSRQVTGYTVSNAVVVTIRNLDDAGTLLDQVVSEGANRIYGISFSVDDPSELIAQARDEAVADARRKAEQLAQGSNATIGDVLVITENVGSPPPMPMLGREVMTQAADAVPIEAGEQSFSARVQVTYELR
jgi:uncharacterized protein